MPSSTRSPSTPRQNYFAVLILMAMFVVIGPLLVLQGIHADHRDRPSLQWPKVSGKIMQCDRVYHPARHGGSYGITATYTYVLNDRRYVAHQIALWSPDLRGKIGDFADKYPVSSTVNVYYDPKNPENAVLIPGPDETDNRMLIHAGAISFIGGILLIFLLRPKLAEYKAQMESQKIKAPSEPHHQTSTATKIFLPEGYAIYTPGSKLKLSICPDKGELSDMLGTDDGQPICDWKPEDRIIDAAGREYRLVKQPGKDGYDLDPTGESWIYERLLNLAESSRRLPKDNPHILRRNLQSAPENERIAVLMKSIESLPSRANWYISGFLLFLVLFFIAIVLIAGKFFLWLSTR